MIERWTIDQGWWTKEILFLFSNLFEALQKFAIIIQIGVIFLKIISQDSMCFYSFVDIFSISIQRYHHLELIIKFNGNKITADHTLR